MLDPAMPFGGFKSSGVGRDFGRDALSAYTEVKSVFIATPPVQRRRPVRDTRPVT